MQRNSSFFIEIDELTIQRAKRGDTDAFAKLYTAYSKPCYNLAYRIAGNQAIAEDAVHDTFIKVMDKISQFRGKVPFWAWLRRIATNTTINILNRRKWMTSLDEINDSENTIHALETAFNDNQGETEHDIEFFLSKLAPQSRAVLLLHDMEGMTHSEIASLFEQTESFSKSILFRARKQLQVFIGESHG